MKPTTRSGLYRLSTAGLALLALQCGNSSDHPTGPTGAGGASSTGGTNGAGASTSSAGGKGHASASSSTGSGGSPSASQSVLQRGNDLGRHATFVQSGLSKSAAVKMAPDATFDKNATFPGDGSPENQGTASVLYLEDGPAAAGCPPAAMGCTAQSRPAKNGLFFGFPALGANPNAVAFDETTGEPVWTAHVSGGNNGIRGTPVIDPTSRRLFVVTGPNPHVVHALSVDDGTEITSAGWPVTLSSATVSSNNNTFNSSAQNQHGALLLAGGILYIPFGGQYGDGGTYRGWIIAVDTADPTKFAGWATQSERSGIWGSGGLASDGTGVFGVTGDSTSVPRNASDSEEVVRLTGMASLTRSAANVFVPTEWEDWDRPKGDLDFGASTPAYVKLPAGSSPAALLVAPAKAGRLYFLDADNLSSGKYDANRTPGGELANLVVSDTFSESVYTAPTIYQAASGLHATINVGVGGTTCPGGSISGEVIVSALIDPSKKPIAKIAWCNKVSAGGGHMNFPPISTTSDDAGSDALVWFVEGAQLAAVDGDTGKRVVTTTGAACSNGSVPSMSFPIAVKNRIVVAALGHLCSWSVGGSP